MAVSSRAGIYRQILLVALIPLAVITVILIFLIYRSTIVEGEQTLDRQGRLLTAQLAANLEYALSIGSVGDIAATVAATVTPGAEVLGIPIGRVTVTDRDHRVVFDSGVVLADDSPLPWPGDWLMATDPVRRFQSPVYLDPLKLAGETVDTRRRLGTVTLTLSTAPIRTALR